MSLAELRGFLTSFERVPEVQARIDKELARIDRALHAALDGQDVAGPASARIREAMEQATRGAASSRGAPGSEAAERAARAAAVELADEARKAVKRDLRLWSPTLYEPGAKRGSEGVRHLSCLVLDYDDGTPTRVASATWAPWLHIVHSTWSYTDEHPKFRLVLPLATPVAADDWEAVWEWASDRTHRVIDPAGKGAAATFALPAIPHERWPHVAYVHEGVLLDPLAEGLVSAPAPPGPDALPPVEEPMARRGGRPVATATRARREAGGWESAEAWDTFGTRAKPPTAPARSDDTRPIELPSSGRVRRDVAVEPPASPAATSPAPTPAAAAVSTPPAAASPTPTPAVASPAPTPDGGAARTSLEVLRDELESVRSRLEQLEGARVADAIERVTALYAEGLLDDEEFALAKRAILRGE